MGKTAKSVRNWADRDSRRRIAIDDAEALDRAHREAGGSGAPMLETYTLRLGVAALTARIARPDIPAMSIAMVKEGAEAVAAQIAAANAPDCPRAIERAIKETEELVQTGTSALAHLHALRRGPEVPPPPESKVRAKRGRATRPR
ncbi:hypothetical protein ACFQ1E_17465 [Sphingomonas canadensis]|uniref:Terminase n=1 Tax=Sphingomonas canadensis TaxID=1219257 RepID=A0ABW3HCK0_9SPHN|nr:hypothetical protein [Sphingomonas canadensis]MCW3837836.1 hypothetical protein [Sphingomonas canadensis]